MGAIPTGLREIVGFANPALKRWANNRCAYGAGYDTAGDEELVDAAVLGELGVEGGGEDLALADQGWVAVAAGEDFNAGSNGDDARCADEDHFKRTAGESCFGGDDCGINLAAVGVALDGCVEEAKRALGGGEDFAGEQDSTGAGAEDGLDGAELPQLFKETVLLEKAEHGGGFAAGQHQSVDGGEFAGLADLDWLRAGFCERLRVAGVVALDGEDADARAGRIQRRTVEWVLLDFCFRQ